MNKMSLGRALVVFKEVLRLSLPRSSRLRRGDWGERHAEESDLGFDPALLATCVYGGAGLIGWRMQSQR